MITNSASKYYKVNVHQILRVSFCKKLWIFCKKFYQLRQSQVCNPYSHYIIDPFFQKAITQRISESDKYFNTTQTLIKSELNLGILFMNKILETLNEL